jgi:protein XRP2
MQQFQISDCEECNIFLFDSCACVYIDECKYCNIFIGACESSIFIRDCEFLTVVCTTQQFRLRDCISCSFAIFCESQPIIESSYDISICNYPEFAYEELSQQMSEAKTNPWNNNWFDVYDFTPKKFNRLNFRLQDLEQDVWRGFLEKLREKMREIKLRECPSIVPRVMGKQQSSLEEVGVLVVFPVVSSAKNGGIEFIQTREHRLLLE